MAYVEFKEYDCSVPYKKFQELKDGDNIYMINYKDLSVDKYMIKDVEVTKVREHDWRKNCYEVMMKIIGYDYEYLMEIVLFIHFILMVNVHFLQLMNVSQNL